MFMCMRCLCWDMWKRFPGKAYTFAHPEPVVNCALVRHTRTGMRVRWRSVAIAYPPLEAVPPPTRTVRVVLKPLTCLTSFDPWQSCAGVKANPRYSRTHRVGTRRDTSAGDEPADRAG